MYVTLLTMALFNSKFQVPLYALLFSPIDAIILVKIHGYHDLMIYIAKGL